MKRLKVFLFVFFFSSLVISGLLVGISFHMFYTSHSVNTLSEQLKNVEPILTQKADVPFVSQEDIAAVKLENRTYLQQFIDSQNFDMTLIYDKDLLNILLGESYPLPTAREAINTQQTIHGYDTLSVGLLQQYGLSQNIRLLNSQDYIDSSLVEIISVPLIENGEVVGVLNFINVLDEDFFKDIFYDYIIYQNDIIISSSMKTQNGAPYVGVRHDISDTFHKVDLDTQYYMHFKPLQTYSEEIVGYVAYGVRQNEFETQLIQADLGNAIVLGIALFLFAIFSTLFFVGTLSHKLLDPFTILRKSSDKVAKGYLYQGAIYDSFKELNELRDHHNIMIRDLRHKIKESEKNRYQR